MESLLATAAVIVIVACCGLPILLIGAATLFNRHKQGREEIPTPQQEKILQTNDSDRPTLDRRVE